MNDVDALETAPRRRYGRLALLTLGGAVCGAPLGWLIGRFVKRHPEVPLGWSDLGALTLAAMFLAIGLVCFVMTLTRRGQALLLNPQAPDPRRAATPRQLAYFRAQALVLLLSALMLAAPVLVAMTGAHLSKAAQIGVMIGLALAFGAQSWLNLEIWKRSDELVRQAVSEGAALCFWILQGALFLWAAGVHLGVFAAVSAWTLEVILMGVYLIASLIVFYRRGLG